jgi:hypothetical protein
MCGITMQIDSWSIIPHANCATTNLTRGQTKEGLIIHEFKGSIKLCPELLIETF